MSKREVSGPSNESDETVLGAGPDIPLGGEGPTDAVADHTPAHFRKAREHTPLLGEGDDIPLGGEGPVDAVADHTPEQFKKARDDQPLLDD